AATSRNTWNRSRITRNEQWSPSTITRAFPKSSARTAPGGHGIRARERAARSTARPTRERPRRSSLLPLGCETGGTSRSKRMTGLLGAPSTTRTCDLQDRNLTLYPSELWARTELAGAQAGDRETHDSKLLEGVGFVAWTPELRLPCAPRRQ